VPDSSLDPRASLSRRLSDPSESDRGSRATAAVSQTAAALALACTTIILTLGVAELALRTLVPPPQHYAVLFPGTRIFEPDPRFIHGVEGPARYEVNAQGYRGRDFGADTSEYRILLVGGSTTECTILDVSENWGSIIEGALTPTRDGRGAWVGNVGRSGLTARDHAVTVKFLLQQYPRIDLIVVLVGINDLTAALRQGNDYQPPRPITEPEAERVQVRNAFAISKEGLYRPLTEAAGEVSAAPWYESLRLYDLARRAWRARNARDVQRQVGGANLGTWRAHRQQASRILDQLPDLTSPLAEYRANLRAIVQAARAHGADVVFLTQPSLWRPGLSADEERLLWLGGTGPFQEQPGQEYYSVPALTEAMARYNRTTLDVCSEENLRCFDLATELPSEASMLYDDVHFTEAGSAVVGRLVAAHLRASLPAVFGEPALADSTAPSVPR
jgi:lysophospholipase L1-like esterase